MSTPTLLPATALVRPAPTKVAGPGRTVAPALARAALYLSPVPLAMAAGEQLSRLPWQVPAGALALAWCARSVLGQLGGRTAATAGAAAAARLVLAGFAIATTGWSAALLLAAASPAGDRLSDALGLAYAVSLPLLGLAAAATVGLVTGAEPTVLRWCLPGLAVAAAALAGWLPLPGQPLALWLLPAVLLPLLRMLPRAWRPACGGVPAAVAGGTADAGGPGGDRRWPAPAGARWRAVTYLLLAAGQAGLVIAVWRSGGEATTGVLSPALLPLLVSLPLIELWAGRHAARVTAGLVSYHDRERHRRHVHRLAWAAVAALLPPLVAGAALIAAAHRLPYGLSRHPGPAALVLALAAGLLLAGLLALGRLLAGRDRPGLSALVTGAPAVAVAAIVLGQPAVAAGWLPGDGWLPRHASLPGVGDLPAIAGVLAVAYAVGLVLAAQQLFNARAGRGPSSPTAAAAPPSRRRRRNGR